MIQRSEDESELLTFVGGESSDQEVDYSQQNLDVDYKMENNLTPLSIYVKERKQFKTIGPCFKPNSL